MIRGQVYDMLKDTHMVVLVSQASLLYMSRDGVSWHSIKVSARAPRRAGCSWVGQKNRDQYSHTAFTQGTQANRMNGGSFWQIFFSGAAWNRCFIRLTRRPCPDRPVRLRRSSTSVNRSLSGPACAIQRLPCFLVVRAPTRFWHLQRKSYYQYFDDLFGRLNLNGGQGQDDDTDEMSCNICGTGMYR